MCSIHILLYRLLVDEPAPPHLPSTAPERLALSPSLFPHLIFLRETDGFGVCAVGCPWWLPNMTEVYRVSLPTRSEWEISSLTVWDKMCFCGNNSSVLTHLELILSKKNPKLFSHTPLWSKVPPRCWAHGELDLGSSPAGRILACRLEQSGRGRRPRKCAIVNVRHCLGERHLPLS